MRTPSSTAQLLVVVFVSLAIISYGKDPSLITKSEVKKTQEIYRNIADQFNALKESEPLSNLLPEDEIEAIYPSRLEGEQISTGAERNLAIRLDRKTLKLLFIKNDRLSSEHSDESMRLSKERRENKRPEVGHQNEYHPIKLSIPDAIQKAKSYLKHFGIEVPSHYKLVTANFGTETRALWVVNWQAFFHDFAYDDPAFGLVPQITVIFQEEKGLVDLERTSEAPEPRNFEVKITMEEAILKASAVAPMVQKSPYYQRTRVAGFVPCSVKEATLKVVVPNWLLDPKRAIWLTTKPPEETRVCWVVRFLTRPSTEKLAVRRLLAPDIIIYIDAYTGETVGANFS